MINIQPILLIFGIWIIVFISHEFGHWIALKCFGVKSPKVRWNYIQWSQPISKRQERLVYASGVILGLIVLLGLLVYYNIKAELGLMMFFGYFIMCHSDLKKLKFYKMLKEVKMED